MKVVHEENPFMACVVFPNDTIARLVEEQLGQAGGTAVLRVRGNSMWPFLRDNRDRVMLRASAAERVRVGDVLFFRYEGRYLLHRVVRRLRDGWLLRGDNCWTRHVERCREEDVIGVVTRVWRGEREWSCASWTWRCASRVWMATYALRVAVMAVRRRLKRRQI